MKKVNKSFVFLISVIFIFSSFAAVLFKADSSIKKYDAFSLYDYNQKSHSLNDYKDSKAIVIMFISTQCPVSNAYNGRMENLYKDYKNKNVTFIGINSNKQESIEDIRNHAMKKNLEFIILKDSNNVIADKFGAEHTPEIYVLNNKFEQLYHGRIDDSRKEENVSVHDLRNALDEILADKTVSVNETKAFGCSIKRVEN